MNSIVWYDYETFGASPKWDRPAQYAAIRTDLDLNEIEPPVEIFCRQADDYLPHPDAVLITGITPQDCQQKGVSEVEFIRTINDMLSVPGTCTAGYNSIRFDDEFTRYALYRNFLDPYAREWQGGNSRWDLLDVVRCAYALRPDGIEWPLNAEGKVSFKLEHLTAANGLDHGKAHDAVSDVRATIALARLIKSKQPKLFDFLFSHRSKQACAALINVDQMKPLMHISGMYSVDQGCMSVVVPLCWHPDNKNSVIVFDLQHDPSVLFDLSADEIKQRVFTKTEELPDGIQRLPLKEIHLNKAPVIAPANTVTPETAARWSIDGAQLRKHLQALKSPSNSITALIEKLHQVFNRDRYSDSDSEDMVPDVDGELYSGFFTGQDKQVMTEIHQRDAWSLVGWQAPFQDSRGDELLFRYRARNYPDTLEDEERKQWEQYRTAKLLPSHGTKAGSTWLTFHEFSILLQQAANRVADDPRKIQWLHELQLYAESIYPADDY